MSPYENWQSLAWGASALIAILVLLLNVVARVAFREKTQS
jgi:phosphate transport system permease protein